MTLYKLRSIHEEYVPALPVSWNAYDDFQKNALFISQIHEGVPFTLLLDIFICPPTASLLLGQLLPLLLVHVHVDTTQQVADSELDGEKDQDGDLSRDVIRCILRLEDFGADDISCPKRDKSHSVDGILRVRQSASLESAVVERDCTFLVCPLVLLALYA